MWLWVSVWCWSGTTNDFRLTKLGAKFPLRNTAASWTCLERRLATGRSMDLMASRVLNGCQEACSIPGWLGCGCSLFEITEQIHYWHPLTIPHPFPIHPSFQDSGLILSMAQHGQADHSVLRLLQISQQHIESQLDRVRHERELWKAEKTPGNT